MLVEWVATFLSIIGAILNARRLKCGFYLWLAANGMWLTFSLRRGLYGASLMWFVYSCICVWGIICWTKKERADA